jgi:hypothetical protein
MLGVVLCSGPSVNEALKTPLWAPGVVTCAVNRGCVWADQNGVSYDYFCGIDWSVLSEIQKWHPKPRKGWISRRDTAELIEQGKLNGPKGLEIIAFKEYRDKFPKDHRRAFAWSMTIAATGLVCGAGCDRVVVFGADWNGRADWDGWVPPNSDSGRGESRWHTEQRDFADTAWTLRQTFGATLWRYGHENDIQTPVTREEALAEVARWRVTPGSGDVTTPAAP